MNSKSWQTEERNDDESDLEDWERASFNPEFSRLEYFPCQHREMEESNGASERRNPPTNTDFQRHSAKMNSMSSSEILETSSPPSNNAQPLNSKSFTTPPDKETSSIETRLVTPHTQVSRSLLSSVTKTTTTSNQHLVDERGLYKINPYSTSPRARKRSRITETITDSKKDDSATKTRASITNEDSSSPSRSGRHTAHHTTVRIKQESPEPGEEIPTFGRHNSSFLENETSNLSDDHRSDTIRIKEESSEEEEEQEQHEGAKKTAATPNSSLQPTTLFSERSTTDQNGLIKSEKLQDTDVSSHPRIRRPVLPPCTTTSLIDPHTGLYRANPYATKIKQSTSNARNPSSSS